MLYLVCVQLEMELENYREKFLSYMGTFLKWGNIQSHFALTLCETL